MKDQLLKIIRAILNPAGYEILKYTATNPSHIVLKHLNAYSIQTVLDIGANIGQYSSELRKAGFKGEIISFEPLSEAYKNLVKRAGKDSNWKAYNYALGDYDGSAIINVSMSSPSSSLLPMTRLHSEAAPQSEYMKEEKIEIKRLDTIFNILGLSGGNVFIKVDTQGYEKKILDGAINSLSGITGMQLELSSSHLYEGEEYYYTICKFCEDNGFRLVRVIPGFTNKGTGEMLQFDAIFFRRVVN